MWLLHTKSYKLREFSLEKAIETRYAILSHCWETSDHRTELDESRYDASPPASPVPGSDTSQSLEALELPNIPRSVTEEFEVTFSDIQDLSRARMKPGWAKVKNACAKARESRYDWIWIDTCCIDKSSSAELSEAINSMFTWYQCASVCYIYLRDVPAGENPSGEDSSFRKSRWFTRGWTLQELIASNSNSVFFSHEWTVIGSRKFLAPTVEEITGIDRSVLATFEIDKQSRNDVVSSTSIAKRFSWAAGRETTRPEDMAYSLMGLFGVHMPIIYGEGGEKAFRRLQNEIVTNSTDHSIFAFGRSVTKYDSLFPALHPPLFHTEPMSYRELIESWSLAPSPGSFQKDVSRAIETVPVEELPRLLGLSPPSELHYVFTNLGVRISLPLTCVDKDKQIYLALLALRPKHGSKGLFGILLKQQRDSNIMYRRLANRHSTMPGLPRRAAQSKEQYSFEEILIDTSHPSFGIHLPNQATNSPLKGFRSFLRWTIRTIYILP
ncbi:heterokaryon incompatibility protein-domain-containing protein [Trametes meyenii]|nr:heterokaryon incompatibility protein-domain-containing protein [Trametes meyenii]